MTNKLFYEDAYIKTFTTNVQGVKEETNEVHVTLENTAFYPGGGGQPNDIGWIDGVVVTRVYEEDGLIYHVMPKAPNRFKNVKCELNWKRRFDHMQQHTGQHLLSACIVDLFQAETTSFHLGEHICTIDIDRLLLPQQLIEVERVVNERIVERMPITVLYPTKSELRKLKLKKEVKKQYDQIRIVTIDDIDVNPCGGTHVASTIELQMLHVKKWERHKTGLRITFVCGARAVQESLQASAFMTQLCQQFSCDVDGVATKITNVSQQLKQAQSENVTLQTKVSEYEVKEMIEDGERMGAITVVHASFENKTQKYATLLANKLTQQNDVIVLFALQVEDSAHLLFASSKNIKKVKMNELLQDAITLIDGRGGGNPHTAQGGGKNVSNLASALDYSIAKLRREL